jgi:hypothetical protein
MASIGRVSKLIFGAANEPAQPGEQSGQVERFHHVIVGPGIEAAHAILGFVFDAQGTHASLVCPCVRALSQCYPGDLKMRAEESGSAHAFISA